MKDWKVFAELFWSANRVESVIVRANTERKAIKFAKEKFIKKYPDVKGMIIVLSCEEVAN